jgi:hypothetical protein
MTHCGPEQRHRRTDWDRAGNAAEDFARRIARDAQRFGERVAEHATEFARDVAREWRHGAGFDPKPISEDVRSVLKEVRGLVADVIDGVDELIGRVFQPEAAGGPETWVRVVTSREVACAGCGRRIGAGEECHLHRSPGGRAFRCAECGPPAPKPSPADHA